MLVAYGVWVTMSRPPRKDRSAMYVIEAEDEVVALTIALQWAAQHIGVAMPIESELLEIMEI